jgi:hypothetical protein
MNTFMKRAAVVIMAGGCALAMTAPSQARYWHRHWHGGYHHYYGAALAAGVATGALLGAAAANSDYYYGPDYAYGPAYPGYGGAYAYDPAPGYYGARYYYSNGDRTSRCTQSPASVNYIPCDRE